jgi:hypothetical protein
MLLIIKIMGDSQNRMRTVHRKFRISSLQPETHRTCAVLFRRHFGMVWWSQIHINIKNRHRRPKGTSALLFSPSNNFHVYQEQWRQNAGRAHASARDARWRIKPKLGGGGVLRAILDVPYPNRSNPKDTQSVQYITWGVWEQDAVENIWT